MRRTSYLLACVTAALLCAAACAQTSGTFELLGNYRALGGQMATTVAPGPVAGSERLYASFLYAENTLDVVAIDPATGKSEVFHNAVPGEYGARNIAVGPDGDVYLGSLPHAHFLHVNRKTHRMEDLGRPSATEEYIWDVAFGADKRLYGATYPGCHLVRYDPATRTNEDLGRMDSTEKYGRWIIATRDGFIYAAVGTARANIYAFNTHTGEGREILPKYAQIVGTPKPFVSVDGKAYARLENRAFALDGFSIKEVTASELPAEHNPNVLRDGRVLDLSEEGGQLTVTNSKTKQQRVVQIDYKGEDLQLFRIGFGPDATLYGSAILPIHFVKLLPASKTIAQIGDLGGGEIYSFLQHKNKLLMAAYSGLAPLMSYTPGRAFHPAKDGNPTLVEYPGWDFGWRPQAMIEGPDGRVYVGATAGYGKVEGPLLSWTGEPDSVELHDGVGHDESVVSLAAWDKMIVAGMTTRGGGGSHPTQNDAHVVLWDTATNRPTWSTVPVAGADSLTDLVVLPSNVLVGIAVKGTMNTLFALDLKQRKLLLTSPLPYRSVVYNGAALGRDGNVWALTEEGIVRIDGKTYTSTLVARSPLKITGGFELRDGAMYFISNSKIYRWHGDADAHP